ncbi:4Fe-4S binding protein [Myxococcota bacterium]|nr:4Fe-4S binding protein [Myxococcota bacterium]MBU1897134.1 4Fe-4S binding protein [Myxococcota bacterium]
MSMSTSIKRIITVDIEKCVNCHNCITVCPVKFCNDASGDAVILDHELCIGCGECIKVCTHEARIGLDDTEVFFRDIRSGVNIIAIVAPAVAASFPNQIENFIGYLKSLGVRAVFDVSFGAELTIKSYIEHIKTKNVKTVISQPCPAIVTYIELHRPDLLQYLAPAHSPMLHTIKMVHEFYPEYAHYSVAVFSPCLAKRREFDETNLGNYNVTFKKIKDYLNKYEINLSDFSPSDFDNPPAERAVLFSAPGGLQRTLERWDPNAHTTTRKIEGPHSIYDYLDSLPESIRKGHAPRVIDCLNCEKGCNGGTGTGMQNSPLEELEYFVNQRRIQMEEHHRKSGVFGKSRTIKTLAKMVEEHWKPGLYDRTYVDRSRNNNIMIPSEEEFNDIYRQMGKYTPQDHLNCSSCGYGLCEKMAIAIYNGLNKIENCFLYREKLIEQLSSQSFNRGK